MTLNLYISWRYLVTKRKEKFVSLISVISILGVAIGVMALVIVLAVMTGFDRDLRDKIVGNYAHITVTGIHPIEQSEFSAISARLKENPHVRATAPFVQGQVLVSEGGKYFALGFKGIDPAKENYVSRVNRFLIEGSLEKLTPGTVFIGKELAGYLGLGVGQSIRIYAPNGKQHSLTISGVFNSGMYEYDLNLIFVNLETAQRILELGTTITAVAVKLDNLFRADAVKNDLMRTIGFDYILKTWTEANASFFAALKLEKITMFIILTLIILVASFNIISTLIVMVVEKTKDIGILKALGMTNADIRRIFTLEGLLIGSLGTFLGAAGGILLCLLLKKYQFIKLPQDIYYIDRLPVSLVLWPDIILIVAASMAITLVSTIYPAHKAAQLKPVEALRYE